MILMQNVDVSTTGVMYQSRMQGKAQMRTLISFSLHGMCLDSGTSWSLGVYFGCIIDADIGYARLLNYVLHRLSANVQPRYRRVVIADLRIVLWPRIDVDVLEFRPALRQRW